MRISDWSSDVCSSDLAAAAAGRQEVLLAGIAGLVAGALSMAAGEYVSVSSQADTEAADIARQTAELATQPEAEQIGRAAGRARSFPDVVTAWVGVQIQKQTDTQSRDRSEEEQK